MLPGMVFGVLLCVSEIALWAGLQERGLRRGSAESDFLTFMMQQTRVLIAGLVLSVIVLIGLPHRGC